MYTKLKNEILGKKYSLSVAYVSETKSQELNKKYRKKDKSTNILSFSLKENLGELVLCKPVIKREAKNFNKNFDEFLLFLVIHGMLHLKGLEHSSIMEKQENFFYKKYDEKYFNRHRCGFIDDQSSRRRILKRQRRGSKKS